MTAASMPGGPFGEPVDVTFTHGESINRLWGIPILGFVVRCIFIIPHAIVLWLLGIVVGLTLLVSWIPVLVSGRQARWVVSIVGGYIRYSIRVGSYLFFLS
ncbi:MAG TPA: DUF4389 domain-containing protein, partial [Candidatus Acidoferrum sp.]|nr:DUF4389 domain-containing protein [Candidatus Acidoferrum sp.]